MVDIRESPSGPLVSTGGGSTEPLSLTFFVDPASTAGDPDGSIGAPFLTIQAGLDRLGEETTPGCLVLAAGDYGGEETTSPLLNVSMVGLGTITNIGPLTLGGDATSLLSVDAWVRASGISAAGAGARMLTVDQTLPSSVIYVDPATTVPTSAQDGSAQRPFQQLADAVTAANALDAATILLPPGLYAEGGTYDFGSNISIIGVGGSIINGAGGAFNDYGISNVIIAQDINLSSDAYLANIFVNADINNATNLKIDACQVFRITGGNIIGRGLGSEVGDSAPRNSSRIGFIANATLVQLENHYVSSAISETLFLTNCSYSNITANISLELTNSFGVFTPSITAGATVLCDPSSYGSIRTDSNSVSIDTSQLIVRQNLGWQLTVTVPVPELAAGAVEYVEVASPLANLTVDENDVVVACPKEDITAPGANAGVYLGVRCTSGGALRFCFMGPIGEVDARDVDFTVSFIT